MVFGEILRNSRLAKSKTFRSTAMLGFTGAHGKNPRERSFSVIANWVGSNVHVQTVFSSRPLGPS